MAIQGVQIIYRLRQLIRLFVDYRAGVDSFNFYYSDAPSGVYTLFGSAVNQPSNAPATRGKIVFEFSTETLVNWDDNARNYIELAPVTGGTEGAMEGPLTIPTRVETIIPKEFSVVYGFNKDTQRFIPVSVDADGNVVTTTVGT
ncbi:MAG: hypothetical protein PHF86_06550 [Candidatus Nanoarchaeia archaeon]|jgi:hypothetical protein|nr:hypothetical protein [Candidatus Nanoarchaeia archaeon]